jgi:HlyD family secretion protein
MTYSRAHGHSPGNPHADNVVDLLQEAALIRDLRRLQRHIERERNGEDEQFPRAIEALSSNSRFDKRGAVKKRPEKVTMGAVGRLFDRLGLHRRNQGAGTSLRQEAPAFTRVSARQNTKAAEHIRLPSTAGKIKSGHAQATAHHSLEESRWLPLAERFGTIPPADAGKGLRPNFLAALKSARIFECLRATYTLLISRTGAAGLEDGSEVALTTRLAKAFECELKIGLRVLIWGVGILGVWAIFVPLSGAVVVPGTLVVESDVKKIQHPAGGVVAKILVRDGTRVQAGDLLIHLDETQLRANSEVLSQQLDQIRVRLARLIAERDGSDMPAMPREMASRSNDDSVTRLWESEISLFHSRAVARSSAKDLLHSRVKQLEEQISGLNAQVKSKVEQHDLIVGELTGVDSLFQKGLVPLTRKTSLQREASRLGGERGQVVAAIAEAKSKISETELQTVRVDQDFRSEVMKDLREAQDKEAELVEKSIAARDLLQRVDLRSPTNGIVHQLSVHTIGGVIAAGEMVMEIVPESDELQIEAKLSPQDIDHVRPGQQAYIRFSAFNQRITPQLKGVVSYVSADLSHDRLVNGAQAYYTVRVMLPSSERRRLGNLQLVSGMPGEVFLQTGSRTMMSYLLKPITDQFSRMFN